VAGVDPLLDALDRRDPLPAAELLRSLGVSAATLSRMVAAAGEQVVRLGRARATRYARTRLVEGVGRAAPLFRVGRDGTPTPAGRVVFLRGGGSWVAAAGDEALYVGLPPALADMAPQGFIGRGFAARYAELGLPPHVDRWSDDHRIRALALRGEDCVGDLLIGQESFARFLSWSPPPASPSDYPTLAERSALQSSGSSAGGERPKFGAFSKGRHVLVKFAPPGDAPAARRWRDLIWCEHRALRLLSEAGVAAAAAEWREVSRWRFLETVRFDRVGERGRRGVVTLEALDDEYFGKKDSWTAAAARLRAPPFALPEADASRLRWLDAFGQLIGNDDRHFGNVAFFVERGSSLRLAPAYDMLPMILAPAAERVVERAYRPLPPHANALAEWKDAAPWALRYWREVAAERTLHDSVRGYARRAAVALEALARRVLPGEVVDRALRAGDRSRGRDGPR
jgi:hypothetical protein